MVERVYGANKSSPPVVSHRHNPWDLEPSVIVKAQSSQGGEQGVLPAGVINGPDDFRFYALL